MERFNESNKDHSSPLVIKAVEWLREGSAALKTPRYETWRVL